MVKKPLTDRDLETLSELASTNKSHTANGFRNGWARAMDCGGSNGSHHSNTLVKLGKRGLVDVSNPSTKRPGRSRSYRSGNGYKINAAGIAELERSGKYKNFLRLLEQTLEERDAEFEARQAR